MSRTAGVRIAVDTGGTFTDIALDNGASLYTARTLTIQQDPMRGEINATLMSLVEPNSRTPFQNEGDIYALIACQPRN